MILTLSLGWEREANHNTILPAMNMMCNSPIPRPHSQVPFPGPIPSPHPRSHSQATSQAPFPGLIPRPHGRQKSLPCDLRTISAIVKYGHFSNKFSIHYRVYRTTKTHPICNFPCRSPLGSGLENIQHP